MIKKSTFLLAYLLCIITMSLYAQSNVDSLRTILKKQEGDTSQVSTYLSLYKALKFENRDLATQYLKTSLILSNDLKYSEGHLKVLLELGDYLYSASQYDSSLIIYENAQKTSNELGSRKGIMKALIGQAKNLFSIQQLDKADSISKLCLEMSESHPIDSSIAVRSYSILAGIAFYKGKFDESLNLNQKSIAYNRGDQKRKADSFQRIGMIYYRLQDFKKANEYYLSGLEIAKEINDKETIASFYDYLGMLKAQLKEFDIAQEYYALAMEQYKLAEDKSNMAHIHVNIAGIQDAQAEYDEAIIEYQKALSLLKETNFPLGECYTLYNLGMAYFNKRDYQKAEEYYLIAKPLSIDLGILHVNKSLAERLSQLYATQGDFEKAFEYHKEFKLLADSTFSEAKARNIAEIEEKYQNEQKQQEIELLSAENQIASLEIQNQETLRNYLIIGAILLLLLIVLIYYRYQLKARAHLKLKELDQLKTNFFTNISHEFRTPLTLILSPLQKLLNEESNSDKKESLTIIHRNASVLKDLTNELLDLSKLEAGELSLNVTQGDFKSFIKVVCASFESLAAAQRVDFIQNLENAPEHAYFDEDKVQKILNNLLSNAFKFTSEGGKVIFNVAEKNKTLAISVQDTGEGISQEDQKFIFKRFYQSTSNKPDAAGTGVGLTLSKELALLHKGDIKIDSEPGQGATFTLLLPINKSVYQTKEMGASEQETNQPIPTVALSIPNEEILEPEASEKIILIVEDNPDLRNHMTSLLRNNFTVKQSINGKVGIEDALSIVPDIIVTDLMMPEADGVELCNTLKTNEKTSHIPIIMLTAKADRDTRLDGLKTGADDFLTKPFDNEELLVRIQNLINQRENLQAKYEQTLRLAPSKIAVTSPEETFIKRALEIVDENLSNSDFTVEAFQKEIGMSRMQLHRKLKALTKLSTSEFIRDIRLQRAADLLTTNGLSASEVAYSCGFNSASYFTQCFKEKFGVSPSSYKT